MVDDQHYAIARQVLQANEFMSIASATPDGNPWVVAVRNRGFVGGCLKWSSDPSRIHSEMIKQNARIGYLLYDSSPRIGDQAKLALYGRAIVDAIEPDEIEGETYSARITEAWALVTEKVDGHWRPKVGLDHTKIEDVQK